MKIGNLDIYGVIYKITNKINGKVYIGQTTNKRGFNGRYNRKGVGIERVYNYHLSCKKQGKAYNYHLLNSIEKYGFKNFDVVEVMDFAFSKKELDIKEYTYIKKYNSFSNGYNSTMGGDGTKKFTSYNASSVVAFGEGFEFIFVSKKRGSEFFGIKSDTNIGKCCKQENSYCGKYNGKKIIWREFQTYNQMTDYDKKQCISVADNYKKLHNATSQKVSIVYKDRFYEFSSILEASNWMFYNKLVNNIYTAKCGIQKCINGEYSSYKGCIVNKIN